MASVKNQLYQVESSEDQRLVLFIRNDLYTKFVFNYANMWMSGHNSEAPSTEGWRQQVCLNCMFCANTTYPTHTLGCAVWLPLHVSH